MEEKKTGFEIAENERQSWWSITMVWAGAMICVTCLMVGGLLGAYLTVGQCIAAILIGYAIISAYMCLLGMQACDLGIPTAVMAGASLGEKVAKYVIAIILAVACVGWFGVQSAVCGMSFSSMFLTIFGVDIPTWLSIVVWGAIMLATACFGFKGLKLLNVIAVPLLLVVCLFGLILAFVRGDGASALAVYQPAVNMGLVFGINYTIATFAVGGVISGDYCRFAKSRKDVVKSTFLGVIPAGFIIMMIGVILTIVTGVYDISSVFVSFGSVILGILGLLALIAGTWTTNVTNAYTGGLSLSILLGLDERRKVIPTAVAGAVGIAVALVGALSAAGFYTLFQSYLSILCALLPPLAGVMIADYWIVGKGKKENFVFRKGLYWPGFTAFIVGALLAFITGGNFTTYFPGLVEKVPFLGWTFFVGPINGIVVSLVLYVVFRALARPAQKATIKES